MSGEKRVVGIDLGTTHSALAFAALDDEKAKTEVMKVPQLVGPGAVDSRALLPSFLYLAHESEGALALPWDDARRFAVGELARSRGLDAPARLVSSAKSWLSHAGIDRRGQVLPLGAPEDLEKISPVEASWRYLEHLIEAFDARFAKDDASASLANQDVVLAVPASFDAAARELTVEAATAAGIEHLTLLEEPQAALYAWIEAKGEAWRKEIHVGDVILVVDIGGGTTDFSAIAAVDRDGSLELVRVAVGDHILLGGDNMDLALAHVVRQKLVDNETGPRSRPVDDGKEIDDGATDPRPRSLDRFQMNALAHAARAAKEELLGRAPPKSVPIAVAARGASLVGGGLRSELTHAEVEQTLVEGFFPIVDASARPAVRARGGLTQLGLPYASDPAITKHLAAFLSRHAGAAEKIEGFVAKDKQGDARDRAAKLLHPTAILFNGGVMKAPALEQRVVATITSWLEADGAQAPRTLGGADLDLAVARGAAAYALARRGKGLRIRGGTARAYYVGIESAVPAVPGVEPPITALCLAPFGMEEGTEAPLPPNELGVVVGEKVSFRFFGSSVRRDDTAGTQLESWKPGEVEELAPIEVTLPAEGRKEGDVVPVRLRARVTEVGTLELEAVPVEPVKKDESFRIELSVRGES